MTNSDLFENAVLHSQPVVLCDTDTLLRYVFYNSQRRADKNALWKIWENVEPVARVIDFFPGVIPLPIDNPNLVKCFMNTRVNDLIDY